jgi:hypothetical protein
VTVMSIGQAACYFAITEPPDVEAPADGERMRAGENARAGLRPPAVKAKTSATSGGLDCLSPLTGAGLVRLQVQPGLELLGLA